MTLMLHAGAEPVDYDALRQLPVPIATETHVPSPHHSVVDMVKYSLGFFGHEITDEHYGVTPDGARFFGVLCLKSTYGDYTDMVGLRNSHDKRFPIGVSWGSKIFVCDNLAFSGDTVLKRKHTANAKRDLPGLVAEVVEPLRDKRLEQAAMFDVYRRTELDEEAAYATIIRMFKKGIINEQRIKTVLDAFENQPHPWSEEPTAWRLFNATTYALTGKVAENPGVTRQLHDVIDAVCEPVIVPRLPAPVH